MPNSRQLKIGLSNADKTNMANQVASQTLDKVINGPITVDGEQTSLKAKIEEVNRAVQSVDDKANDFGDHPNMTVAKAHDLVSEREIDDAEDSCPPITIGTAGGDAEIQTGYQKVEEIRGKSVEWNQLFNYSHVIKNGSGSISTSGTTTTITYSDEPSTSDGFYCDDTRTKLGHKYLIRGFITASQNSTIRCGLVGNNKTLTADVKTDISSIYVAETDNSAFSFYLQSPSWTGGGTLVGENIIIVDLTLLGKEYESVLAFNSDYPLPYYDFNAGQLLSSKSTALESIGQNLCIGVEQGLINSSTGADQTYSKGLRTLDYIEIIPSQVYKVDGYDTLSSFSNGMYVYCYDANKNFIGRLWIMNSTQSDSYKAKISVLNYHGSIDGTTIVDFLPNTKYIRLGFADSENDLSPVGVALQVRLYWNTPNVPHKPYEKQTINLPNLELRSAGNVYDVIYSSGGGKRRIGTYTFTGEESGTIVNTDATTGYVKVRFAVLNGKGKTGGQLLCPIADKAPYSSYVNTNAGYCFMPVETGFDINIGKTNVADTLSALVGKTIFFELGTETDITEQENPGFLDLLKVDNYGVIKFNSEQALQIPQAYFIRYTISPAEWVDTAYEYTGGKPSNLALKSDNPEEVYDISLPSITNASTTLIQGKAFSNGTALFINLKFSYTAVGGNISRSSQVFTIAKLSERVASRLIDFDGKKVSETGTTSNSRINALQGIRFPTPGANVQLGSFSSFSCSLARKGTTACEVQIATRECINETNEGETSYTEIVGVIPLIPELQ